MLVISLKQHAYGGTAAERAECIIATNDGGYAFTGFTDSNDVTQVVYMAMAMYG
ncbi:MAG: hypothetical protein R2794_03930 [Chitinophagales bacterium]